MGRAKQPERLCVGCRTLHPKDELLRVVRHAEARRHGGLSWSLKGRVAPAVYDAAEAAVSGEECAHGRSD